jgi:hypothetical protein
MVISSRWTYPMQTRGQHTIVQNYALAELRKGCSIKPNREVQQRLAYILRTSRFIASSLCKDDTQNAQQDTAFTLVLSAAQLPLRRRVSPTDATDFTPAEVMSLQYPHSRNMHPHF